MSDRTRYLLVCSITSGRNFPERKNSRLVIEGKFNDEILESDPVQQTTAPQVNTELAWELDKKSLHQHKMQRTPIKLNIISISERARELIGYIVLDLRAAGPNIKNGKWMNMLNNKYSKFKSELNIKLALEEENGDLVNNINQESGVNKGGKLNVEKRELDGKPFLQVGKGGDMYIFSLSILEGEDLLKLLPTKMSLNSGFYWFYQLRGNDVIYNPFRDLGKPFPMERASMNIRATKDALLRFLTSDLNYIEIHLCSEEFSLGTASVDYSISLNKQFHYHDFDHQPIIFETFYSLKPSGQTGGQPGAKVKISVAVRREHVTLADISEQITSPPVAAGPMVPTVGLPTPKVTNDYDTDHGIDDIQVETDDGGITTTETHMRVPPVSNHFTFSLELISLTSQITKCRVQFKYCYPFFGSSSPVFSGAPVLIQWKNEEIKFPEPFCQFSFACPSDQLETQFRTVPFVLDLLAKTDEQRDSIVGNCILPLQKLLPVGNTKPKVINDEVAVLSANKLIGSLKIKYWIENKGPIHQQIVLPPNEPVESPIREIRPPAIDNSPQNNHPCDTPCNREHNKREQFKAALELEMWKAEQEENFNSQLKQKEKDTLMRLGAEFAQRETEREQLMSRRVGEYEKMEKQLKKALQEAKKGELTVLEHEKELTRMRDDLQKEKDRIRQDVKTTVEQQKRELNGILKVERAKTAAAEERARLYRAELDESENKYKLLLKELETSKRALPDPHLQAEIRTLILDKSEMEKKVDTLTKAKTHYKQQWNRAIKELSLAKQREQESALARVKRQQAELDEMRLKYTIHNEEKITKNEQNELQTMRNELQPTRETDVTDNMRRLKQEKEQLLKSGVYEESDRIIQEINHQIKEALLDT